MDFLIIFNLKQGVTQVEYWIKDVIASRPAVLSDFTLFFAQMFLERTNTLQRYVFRDICNQEHGLIGDSQMHAYAESLTFRWFGWKRTFDANHNIHVRTKTI